MKKREQLTGKSLHHSSDIPVQSQRAGTGSGNRFDLSQMGSARALPTSVQASTETDHGAQAASAFDSLSGQTLTPMSVGPALSSSAPVQAKKGKKSPTPASLADMATQIERDSLITSAAANLNMVDTQEFVADQQDAALERADFDKQLGSLNADQQNEFRSILMKNYVDAFADPKRGDYMEQHTNTYYNDLAAQKSYNRYVLPYVDFSVSEGKKYFGESLDGGLLQQVVDGTNRLTNAGSGVDAHGNFVRAPQKNSVSRARVNRLLKKLRKRKPNHKQEIVEEY